jgi:large subunit ribosomal protein L3
LTTSSSSSSSSTRGARLQTFARVDGGVGVFGNKAGMTQIFTDDGLCVPVTVIAVKDGNYVSAVRLSFL